MAPMVEIKGLSKSFGALRAVDDISFSVDRGEVLGFLGPNGAGKSTTMKMITGFLAPTSGTAVVCGHDVVADPLGVKRAIGYLPEGAPSYAEMTPRSFLAFIAEVRGYTGAEAGRRVERAVAATQLAGVLDQRFETLSKGFKRRVGLAQAILHDPQVLVLDEPTDGLDPNQKHEVRRLIREMAADKAIILSTHILEEVDAVCTRAMVIAKGRVLADGQPHELLARAGGQAGLSVTVGGGTGDVAALLGGVDGVQSVSTAHESQGELRLDVLPAPGRDVSAAVSAALHAAGWQLHELRPQAARLDDVFREITLGAGSRS